MLVGLICSTNSNLCVAVGWQIDWCPGGGEGRDLQAADAEDPSERAEDRAVEDPGPPESSRDVLEEPDGDDDHVSEELDGSKADLLDDSSKKRDDLLDQVTVDPTTTTQAVDGDPQATDRNSSRYKPQHRLLVRQLLWHLYRSCAARMAREAALAPAAQVELGEFFKGLTEKMDSPEEEQEWVEFQIMR